MPANKKPADQRQDNRKGRELSVVPASGSVAADRKHHPWPSMRRWWKQSTKDSWEAFWTSDLAGAVTDADNAVLYRLFDMRQLYEDAMEKYRATPYVNGSTGQPVTSPAFKDAMALSGQIQNLEDRLGLSPKARANLGIAFGQAALTAADLNALTPGVADADVGDFIEVEGWEEAQ